MAHNLGLTTGEYRNYEVFVTPLCHGYVCDANFCPTMNQTKDVIDQVIAGVKQLFAAGKTHNDLKPTNLLYLKTNTGYDIKVSDFGQAGKSGGTPGWTAPVFHRSRESVKEDIYSVGWICLRLLCESKELFLSLRNSYVEDVTKQWMTDFGHMNEINFVSKMVGLKTPLTIHQVKYHWNQIRSSVRMIDISRLQKFGVPSRYLRVQLER